MSQRGLAVAACAVGGAIGILLAIVGAFLLIASSRGVSKSTAPPDYAAGMFVGGVAWMAVMFAALFLIHAWWCWSRAKRLELGHRAHGGEMTMLLFPPASAAVIALMVALRIMA